LFDKATDEVGASREIVHINEKAKIVQKLQSMEPNIGVQVDLLVEP